MSGMSDVLKGAYELLGDVALSGGRIASALAKRWSRGGTDYLAEDHAARLSSTVERLHPRRMQLEVTEVIDETPSTKTLRLCRTDGELPPWRPGQYVSLAVEIAGVRTSRAYSMSSAPGEPHLDLTVRQNPGGFVAPHLLATAEVGQAYESSGPQGSFYHEPLCDGHNVVLLAGGSGITPFMGMLRAWRKEGWPVGVVLLYGSRVPEDIIFHDELVEMAAASPKLTYVPVISEPPGGYAGRTGFMDAACIRGAVGEPGGRTYFLCGPTAMYDFCLGALGELGIPEHRIKRELYGPPRDVTREVGWPDGVRPRDRFQVEVEGRGTIGADAGEPLLVAFERGGIAVRSACRSGECSLCRTRIVEGRVFMPEHTGIRESDRAHGFAHACVAYPLSDLKVRL